MRLFAGADSYGDIDPVTCDAVTAIADPYPMAVLGTLLDIPPAELPEVRRATTDLGLAFSLTVATNLERIESALQYLFDVADRLIEARRRRPGADLLGRLVAGRDGDERLTEQEFAEPRRHRALRRT